MLLIAPLMVIYAQKKEIAQAKDNVKAGKSLVEAETSMRKLLADSANRRNEKIWLVLFDAVKKQYEGVNEKMYLKQSADTSQLFATTYRMFRILEGLDSIEALPDNKGKVKMAYRKRHSDYLNSLRPNLFNGGLFHMNKKEYQMAFDFFAAYVDCANQPLFSSYKYRETDSRLARAAFYTVYNGFKAGDAVKALQFADIAQEDTSKLNLTYQYMAETYRIQKDTLKCLDVLHSGFSKFPNSEYFFSHLFDYYFKNGDGESALTLCDSAMDIDSTNTVALIAKSAVLLSRKQYDECVAVSDKAIALDRNSAEAYLNAGLAYFNRAVEMETSRIYSRDMRENVKNLYSKSLPYMQRYRVLAPEAKDKWAMPLYTIYLNLNMGKEFDEIDSLLRN